MGQQQLVLLVLALVVLGLAINTGLELFDENRRKAAGDEIITVGARIAGEATAWVLQPSQVGGGGRVPTGLEFSKLGYTEEGDGSYTTGDANYTLTTTAEAVTISGTESQGFITAVLAVYGSGEECLALAKAHGTVPATPGRPADCGGW